MRRYDYEMLVHTFWCFFTDYQLDKVQNTKQGTKKVTIMGSRNGDGDESNRVTIDI